MRIGRGSGYGVCDVSDRVRRHAGEPVGDTVAQWEAEASWGP